MAKNIDTKIYRRKDYMNNMKRVRMLLRVSSNQQLDADGDLNVQRGINKDYILKHDNWVLDNKEYFEGGVSGYKNSVKDRNVLQEALKDAANKEYDILVVYKDDRIGRRMWEIGAYVMQLKNYGVDVYTTKDGCISPENDDIMGQMMLALRYGNAQKSSSDTGQRVKDTACKLVRQGKFMGGKAPYGYQLVLSNEISKHGRALHKLEIVPEQADVVKHIYNLSFDKEFGSAKIAKILNEDKKYKELAPNDFWKSGTITSILTNPIYCGITAYKRREKIDGKYHTIGSDDWIYSDDVNEDIMIIDIDLWNKVQKKRTNRSFKYKNTLEEKGVKVLTRNDGMLPLIDVAYCGYCGGKLTNGSKYNYWTIKSTGEKRASKTPVYKCQNAVIGIPHDKTRQFKGDKFESIVFKYLADYISKLQDDTSIFQQILDNNKKEKDTVKNKINSLKQEIQKDIKNIEVMKEHIPEAMTGQYPLSVEIISDTIKKFEQKQNDAQNELDELLLQYENMEIDYKDWNDICEMIPTWKDVFYNADRETKRILINRLVDKVYLTNEEIRIQFKINLENMHLNNKHTKENNNEDNASGSNTGIKQDTEKDKKNETLINVHNATIQYKPGSAL